MEDLKKCSSLTPLYPHNRYLFTIVHANLRSDQLYKRREQVIAGHMVLDTSQPVYKKSSPASYFGKLTKNLFPCKKYTQKTGGKVAIAEDPPPVTLNPPWQLVKGLFHRFSLQPPLYKRATTSGEQKSEKGKKWERVSLSSLIRVEVSWEKLKKIEFNLFSLSLDWERMGSAHFLENGTGNLGKVKPANFTLYSDSGRNLMGVNKKKSGKFLLHFRHFDSDSNFLQTEVSLKGLCETRTLQSLPR